MTTINDDIKKAAEWISTALIHSGFNADFKPRSLKEIDRFFDKHSKKGKAKFRSLLSKDLGVKIFALGSYIGEVIRIQKGGKWIGNDNDPENEINIKLVLDDGTTCWPIIKVMKRFKNGKEDSLSAFGVSFGLKL